MKYLVYIILFAFAFLLLPDTILGQECIIKKISFKKTAYDCYNRDLDPKFAFGLKGGISRVGIITSFEYSKPDKITHNYHPIFGCFVEMKLIERWHLGFDMFYKQMDFQAYRYPKRGIGYEIAVELDYVSSHLVLSYRLPVTVMRPRIFAGFEFSRLISSAERYISKYPTFQIKGFSDMRRFMKKNTAFLIIGAGCQFSLMKRFILVLETELSIGAPTDGRYVPGEGAYDALLYPFKFFNISLVVNIPIHQIK